MFKDEKNEIKTYDQILERLSHAIKDDYDISIGNAKIYVIDNFETLLEMYDIKEVI